MKLVHTADWHLGRLFHGVNLTEDQAYILERLVEFVREEKPDALVVAGDVYDRAVPPADAVALLDDVLCRLVLGLQATVIMIAGNHDSPQRLSFGSRLLESSRLHIVGDVSASPRPVSLEDAFGPVHVHAIPYAEPPLVRERLARDDIADHEAALRALIDRLRPELSRGIRSVLVAHAFLAGGEPSESERPLSLGGASMVSSESLAGIQYAALGHLHRPQKVGREEVQYSGSLLKYSFSEADHAKSVTLVEMDAAGACRVSRARLTPRRDVRCIRGHLADLLEGPKGGESKEDYLSVSLLDRGAILDAMGKLREVYPNVLHIERPTLTAAGAATSEKIDPHAVSDEQLFGSFFKEVTGEDLKEEERAAYAATTEEMRRREREGVP